MSYLNKLNNERVTAQSKWHALSLFKIEEPNTLLKHVKLVRYI